MKKSPTSAQKLSYLLCTKPPLWRKDRGLYWSSLCQGGGFVVLFEVRGCKDKIIL